MNLKFKFILIKNDFYFIIYFNYKHEYRYITMADNILENPIEKKYSGEIQIIFPSKCNIGSWH